MKTIEGGEPIKFSTEREKSENETLWAEILPVFSELKYSYDFGGDEDEEGGLTPGSPDFEAAKEKLGTILSEAPESLKEKTMETLQALSKKCESTKEGEWFDFGSSIYELENLYLADLGTQEQIAAKEELLKNQQEQFSAAFYSFINGCIVRSPVGSAERRVWGNALKDYEGGDLEPLITLLEGEFQQAEDPQVKEWLKFLKFNKRSKNSASGDMVVYPPTGSYR